MTVTDPSGAILSEAVVSPASLVGTERRAIMLGIFRRLQALHHPDRPELGAEDRGVAFARGVLQAQIDRIHA